MRSILRVIFAIALLLGGGGGDWSQVASKAHEACCCGAPAGLPDRCPCPKPEGSRSPQSSSSSTVVVAASPALRRAEGQRRTEPRPEPATWAGRAAEASDGPDAISFPVSMGGRDPDLGRHLARLSTFRI